MWIRKGVGCRFRWYTKYSTFLFIPKEGQPQISMGALPREEFVKQIDTFLLKKK